MKEIKLTQGKSAIVDDEDYEGLNRFKWFAEQRGNTFYARSKSSTYMHRFILGLEQGDGKEIDHKDGNGLNNCRENLRLCTRSQNNINGRVRKGTSKYKGVCWDKRDKKWKARISIDKKRISLGNWLSEIGAARAYDIKATELHGEFARLNFPIIAHKEAT